MLEFLSGSKSEVCANTSVSKLFKTYRTAFVRVCVRENPARLPHVQVEAGTLENITKFTTGQSTIPITIGKKETSVNNFEFGFDAITASYSHQEVTYEGVEGNLSVL